MKGRPGISTSGLAPYITAVVPLEKSTYEVGNQGMTALQSAPIRLPSGLEQELPSLQRVPGGRQDRFS